MSTTVSASAPPSIAPNRTGGKLTLLSWAHFLNDGSANYLPGILPAVLIASHEPIAAAGTLMAALLIGQALQPFTGILSDRVGGRSVFIIGLAGSSLGGALLGFTHSVWLLVLFLLMIGIGNSLFHPQALAIVRSVVKQNQQGLRLSGFLVGGEFGRGVFPMLSSWIVVSLGLPYLWLMAIPTIITVPFLYRHSPSLPIRRDAAPRVHWRSHMTPLLFLVGFAGLRSLMTYGVVTYMPVLWHESGGTLVIGASIITTVLVVGIIGNLAGGHLADRYGRRPVLVISSLLSTALLPLMTTTTGPLLWLFAGMLGITLFSSASVTVLIGQDAFPENRSLGSGIALGLANGIGALLVFASGQLVRGVGVDGILWSIAVCGGIATLLAVFMPRSMTAHAGATPAL
ncbi:MAG: MFS transporter [Bacilli bacterium]